METIGAQMVSMAFSRCRYRAWLASSSQRRRKAVRVVRFGDKPVILDRICAVEKGEWRNDRQDWLAVLVCSGGTRVETDIFIEEAVAILEGGCGQTVTGDA
jgi:hypothetical protein